MGHLSLILFLQYTPFTGSLDRYAPRLTRYTPLRPTQSKYFLYVDHLKSKRASRARAVRPEQVKLAEQESKRVREQFGVRPLQLAEQKSYSILGLFPLAEQKEQLKGRAI